MRRPLSPALLVALSLSSAVAAVGEVYQFSTNAFKNGFTHGTAYTWGLGGSKYSSEGQRFNNLVNDVKQEYQYITSATLTIYGLRDWKVEPADVLYVNILNGLQIGTDSYTYNSSSPNTDYTFGKNAFYDSSGNYNNRAHRGLDFNDALEGTKVIDGVEHASLLKGQSSVTNPGTWSDPKGAPYGAIDLTIEFTAANLALLERYLEAETDPYRSTTVGLGFAAECHYYTSSVKLVIKTGTYTPPPENVPDAGTVAALLGLALPGLALIRRRIRTS